MLILGADQNRRHAAAKLIQATWRQHRHNKKHRLDAKAIENGTIVKKTGLKVSFHRLILSTFTLLMFKEILQYLIRNLNQILNISEKKFQSFSE